MYLLVNKINVDIFANYIVIDKRLYKIILKQTICLFIGSTYVVDQTNDVLKQHDCILFKQLYKNSCVYCI